MDAVDGDNLASQADEVEALAAIYGDDWRVEDKASRTYSVRVRAECRPDIQVLLQVTLPTDYPAQSPPLYTLSAPWLRGNDRMKLSNTLEDIFCENIGENIIYMWAEIIREFLNETSKDGITADSENKQTANSHEDQASESCAEQSIHTLTSMLQDSNLLSGSNPQQAPVIELPPIYHSDNIITDRKSVFQSHLAPVFYKAQITMVLDKLLENKKIANATHNIYAYRISRDNGTFLQGCEDDGETHAGSRVLHLMQIMDVSNVMVIVTRWYGGSLLGPDRFKHINNAARAILVEQGYLTPKTDKKVSPSSKKGKRS